MHLSLLAAGVGPGDEVITTPITWPATANVIVHCGARPVFVDVRDSDLNIDPDAAAAAVTERTKAILPVDLAGQPCDLDPLLALGVPVIEDAAHATESVYRGRKVGAISLATCFSLYATKNVAAGEGGMVTTDDDDLAAELRNLRLMRRGEGSLYDVTVAGWKANLSDLLATVALCQLDKIEEHAAIRRRHVAAYDAAVAELPGIDTLARDERDGHALHLYVIRIDAERAGADRDAYQRALGEEMIGTSIHFLPVHRLTYYRERYPDQPSLPVAERAGRPGALAAALTGPLRRGRRGRDRGAAARARTLHGPPDVSRSSKVGLQLLVSGAVLALLLWQIDLGQTIDILRDSQLGLRGWPRSLIFLATTWLMAWRWWALLRVRGVHEPYGWLVRMYFVSYAASQVLPTAVGGDAVRIIEHARRRPDVRATAAGAVVMERILGSAGTLVLVAIALALAAGRYEGVRLLVILELALLAALIILGLLLFSKRLGRHLEERLFPLGKRLRIDARDAEPLPGDARVPQREGRDAPGPGRHARRPARRA